ncbi:MAG: hypothetical protein AAFR47_04680 [Pseudomonadota bacterium]
MSLEVAEGERGVVRVFRVEADGAEARRIADPEGPGWPLPGLLGVDALTTEDVQVFQLERIGALGLAAFLAEGYDIAEDELAPHRPAFDAMTGGVVAVLRSGAFAAPVTLEPAAAVALVGTFHEPEARGGAGYMPPVESARPGSGPEPEPEAEETAASDARVVERFAPDRDVYIRSYLWLAAAGMVGAVVVLYLLGNSTPWVGAPAALLAIAVRGGYLASEELGQRWQLTERSVRQVSAEGRVGRSVALSDMAEVRRLGSAVQIVTQDGHKFLLKYLSEPEAVRQRLAAAAGVTAQ